MNKSSKSVISFKPRSLVLRKPVAEKPKTEIIMGPMSRAELTRYSSLKAELADQLDIINTAFIKVGRIMSQIRDQRLYRGEFDTFEQFCKSIVGKDKRYVNRLIMAHDVVEQLMLEGIKESELPNSERVCRELANYPTADITKIYRRAKQLALTKGKAQPDTMTVREAAATLEGVSDEARRRQITELLQRFEGIARAMKLTIGWGDLEPPDVERLRAALETIASLAATHLEGLPKEFNEESRP